MHILHIDCSPRQDGQSRRLSAGIVAQLHALSPDAVVTRRDISALPPPDAHYASLLARPAETTGEQPEGSVGLSDIMIREIEAADILVLGTPVHNFTVPAALKSWLDHVVRVNRTVALGLDGKQGLIADRPVLVGVAAGGIILGEKAQQPDFFTPYLKAVLGCIGLQSVHFISVQGTAFCDEDVLRAAADQALTAMTADLRSSLSMPGRAAGAIHDA
ncbi:FMN-dependent NADH-azoreductase [Asaia krungthepensis]|uniref:FMN dependent NADH:quinone oxidoreductase n=1 Tax=Asaia krungthepensis NRIC 0535 TaxID=1307925 RepID=A0ABQ0Q2A2_9PROT|nr:NAD(P)H-dependent oxidoreductase [Asaia krungthepensis]GBQ87973.1 NADH/NADPH dehydrogenase [Asaia krungthepensis NRIC 0535]